MGLVNRVLQEQNHHGVAFEEEEDDEDPIFVLTDEWKEFFAKSEAKRKLGTPFLGLRTISKIMTFFGLIFGLVAERKQAKKGKK